jgi:cation:H+ antiporter
VGNVIGSNIFNLAGVLGVAGIVRPVSVDSGVLWVEFPAVLALSLLVFLITLFPLARGQYRIRRWEGAILLGAYLGLGWWVLGW